MTLAKYIRLSLADVDVKCGDKVESNSIINQRNLLDEYIHSHPEFSGCKVLEFLDDGRSGTNMNRPGMCTLLEAAKEYTETQVSMGGMLPAEANALLEKYK